jgi:PD-(D/E)XK nuclease superfamily
MARRPLYQVGQTTPFQISRAKIEDYIRCPRCFVLEQKHGLKRPSSVPFTLNTAVDHQLKKEFDIYRASGQVHPLVAAAGLDLVPFSHPQLDEWRENFKGVRFATDDFLVTGAVDDLWVNSDGELFVVDYKSTGRQQAVTELGEGGFYDGYRRQMEIYQWLLRKNGFKVSNTGFWVYVTATQKQDRFDGQLVFESNIVSYEGDSSWVDGILNEIKVTLENPELPFSGTDCDLCRFARDRNTLIAQFEEQDELPPVCAECGNRMSKAVYGMTSGPLGPGFVSMGCIVGFDDPQWVCTTCEGYVEDL